MYTLASDASVLTIADVPSTMASSPPQDHLNDIVVDLPSTPAGPQSVRRSGSNQPRPESAALLPCESDSD